MKKVACTASTMSVLRASQDMIFSMVPVHDDVIRTVKLNQIEAWIAVEIGHLLTIILCVSVRLELFQIRCADPVDVDVTLAQDLTMTEGSENAQTAKKTTGSTETCHSARLSPIQTISP